MKQKKSNQGSIQQIKNRFHDSVTNNKEAVRFLLLFIFFSILFFTIFYLIQEYLNWMLVGTAWITGTIANVIGLTVIINGSFLNLGTTVFEIIAECTGIFAIFITMACILAYPATYKQKIIGLILIIPLILILNIIRLLILIFVGKHYLDLFEYVHSYLWQATFIIFIILAWFLWIELVVKK
jgi:archaeosortase B (VPXXXP-CTERM-specific)